VRRRPAVGLSRTPKPKTGSFEKHRIYGTGPRDAKLGGRIVYRLEDLQAWVESAVKASTSDRGKTVAL
jgi:hypothetical protein